MSPSGIQVNKTFIIVIVGVFAGVVVVYRFWNKSTETDKKPPVSENKMADAGGHHWYKAEFVDVPKDLVSKNKDLVKNSTVDVKVDGKTLKIFIREAKPKEPVSDVEVLLLHGQVFSSKNWHEIGTLSFLATCGYRAVAIDLPGYGNSKDEKADSKGPFIAAVIDSLKLHRPVIVSPSMSGGFSLPYLFDKPETAADRSLGYVPVAPVSTENYVTAYNKSQIPTMIVYGEKDTTLGTKSLNNLKNLPNSKAFEIKNAKHPAYLDDTPYFHKLMYNFLKIVASLK